MCRDQSCRGTCGGQGTRESRQRATMRHGRVRFSGMALGGGLAGEGRAGFFCFALTKYRSTTTTRVWGRRPVVDERAQDQRRWGLTAERRGHRRARHAAAQKVTVRSLGRDATRGWLGVARTGTVRTRRPLAHTSGQGCEVSADPTGTCMSRTQQGATRPGWRCVPSRPTRGGWRGRRRDPPCVPSRPCPRSLDARSLSCSRLVPALAPAPGVALGVDIWPPHP